MTLLFTFDAFCMAVVFAVAVLYICLASTLPDEEEIEEDDHANL